MENNKIKINMYAGGLNIKGQGVGTACIEQVELVRNIDEFDVSFNGKHNNSYDIRHIHTLNIPFYFKANKKAVNICYVHFIPEYDDGSLSMPKFAFKAYRNYVLRYYRKMDEVVVVNPYFIPKLKEIGIPDDKITYIPNFVSRERFFKLNDEKRKIARQSFGFKDDEFVVLGVGQTQTRKGIKDFYDIAVKNPNMRFVWAGGFTFKTMTAGYKEIKELMDNPPRNLQFLGIIDRNKMNDLYNASDTLFLPSYQELFPMTILECINSETPFLVRDLDLYKDIFLSKYLVGNNNEEFSLILNRIRDDKDFLIETSNYSKEIAEYYSKEHVKEIWTNYYNRIFNKYPKKKKK